MFHLCPASKNTPLPTRATGPRAAAFCARRAVPTPPPRPRPAGWPRPARRRRWRRGALQRPLLSSQRQPQQVPARQVPDGAAVAGGIEHIRRQRLTQRTRLVPRRPWFIVRIETGRTHEEYAADAVPPARGGAKVGDAKACVRAAAPSAPSSTATHALAPAGSRRSARGARRLPSACAPPRCSKALVLPSGSPDRRGRRGLPRSVERTRGSLRELLACSSRGLSASCAKACALAGSVSIANSTSRLSALRPRACTHRWRMCVGSLILPRPFGSSWTHLLSPHHHPTCNATLPPRARAAAAPGPVPSP